MSGYELKSGARKLMRENSPKVFFVGLLFIVLVTVMTDLQQRLTGASEVIEKYLEQMSAGIIQTPGTILSYTKPGGLAFAFVLSLLSPIITTGYKSYCLKISRGQKADYVDVFNGFLFFGKVILLEILINIFILLWSFLLIVPGIAAYYRYRQAFYILIDDPSKGILQCIRESKHLMKGKKLDLFLVDLSFIGWLLLDMSVTVVLLMTIPLPIVLPIVSIWLTPYFNLTCAEFYNRLIRDLVV